MKSILRQIAGGIAIIVIASIVAVAHNAVRSQPVKLIQRVEAVSTARHDAPEHTSQDADTAAADEALPEGAISLDEMKSVVDGNLAVIFDARSADAFAEGHIPGAINIPYDKVPDYVDTVQMSAAFDERVVVYCWSPSCDFGDQLATELKIMGYENVAVFTGGWQEWTDGGNTIEEGMGDQ